MPIAEAGFDNTEDVPAKDMLVALGPTILVIVGLQPEHAPEGTPSDEKSVLALIDTGATLTCIDADLANELSLPVIDKQICSGINGSCEMDVFAAQITAPALGGFRQYGRFAGVKLRQGGQKHEILIGRTFLEHVLMVYDGRTGRVQLSI